MSLLKILILFLLVNLPLALGIYMGTSAIPDYLDSHREKIRQSNYFLAQSSEITLDEKGMTAAQQCRNIMEEALGNFRLGITGLGQAAYKEYKKIKAENPET